MRSMFLNRIIRGQRQRFGLLIAIIAAALAAIGFSIGKANTKFSMTLSGDLEGTGQLFYSTDGAFSEERSIRFPLQASRGWKEYDLVIPDQGTSRYIRFDPCSLPCKFSLKEVRAQISAREAVWQGQKLESLNPVSQVEVERITENHASFRALGADPYLLLEVTQQDLRSGPVSVIHSWRWVWLFLLLVLVGAYLSTTGGKARFLRIVKTPPSGILAVGALVGFFLATEFGGLSCMRASCGSQQTAKFAFALMLSLMVFGAVGYFVLFRLLGDRLLAVGGLAGVMLVGQVFVVLYIYIRSWIGAIIPMPITAYELWSLGIVLFLWGLRRSGEGVSRALLSDGSLPAQLALIFAVCYWAASRELPKIYMLSSDPDVHAFFALIVSEGGKIPMELGGDGVLNYPGGLAALTYAFSAYSFLDVRNVTAALPLLQTLAVPMMISSAITCFAQVSAARKVLILTSAVSVTVMGFLFPVFTQFAHLEGLGRQVAVAFYALVIVLVLLRDRDYLSDASFFLLSCPLIAFLAYLNPVSAVIPSIFLGAYATYRLVYIRQLRQLRILYIPMVAAVLLLLDPYYLNVALGNSKASGSALSFGAGFNELSVRDIYENAINRLLDWRGAIDFYAEYKPGSNIPLFAMGILSVALVVLYPLASALNRRNVAIFVGATTFFFGVWFSNALFLAVSADPRFYLLAPYFQISVWHHKWIVLIVGLAAYGIVSVKIFTEDRVGLKSGAALLALSALLVLLFRPANEIMIQPRNQYCGSMGCPAADDFLLFDAIKSDQSLYKEMSEARTLIVNSVNVLGNETWLFPVGGGRAFPHEVKVPVAFYYLYGDADFTNLNYQNLVCRKIDINWLRLQDVEFIYLPQENSAACLSESLLNISGVKTIKSVGGARLLRLPASGKQN